MSEEIDALLWRLEQFQTLGFTALEAVALTDSDADLGQARQLRKTKCLASSHFAFSCRERARLL